jgi:hypothetical protein
MVKVSKQCDTSLNKQLMLWVLPIHVWEQRGEGGISKVLLSAALGREEETHVLRGVDCMLDGSASWEERANAESSSNLYLHPSGTFWPRLVV